MAQHTEEFRRAAELIKQADALLITTGAGMGVSSGLGTFRGAAAGVWPPLKKLGIDFSDMSCPRRFKEDAAFAWSFWNFRYTSYTGNPPHEGYHIIKSWCDQKKFGGFSETSNIDGHWEACGFDPSRVCEIHGTIRYLQCQRHDSSCSHYDKIWPTPHELIFNMTIDPNTDKVTNELPTCPGCGGVARPAVLMFGDGRVQYNRISNQHQNLNKWLREVTSNNGKLVVLELGAGVAISSIRGSSFDTCSKYNAPLIRINPEHPELKTDKYSPEPTNTTFEFIGLPLGALEAITGINNFM